MAGFSLREAAQQAGTSKSTILRAIQNGRLSATRTDDGGYSIDPAELFRVYPPKGNAVAADHSAHHGAGQDAPPSTPPQSPDATDATELRIRNAALEAELSALRTILEGEKRRAEELREDRDRWHAQAERLALPAPVPAPVAPVAPVPAPPAQRSWWSWRRAG